jgi:hypothetical protein
LSSSQRTEEASVLLAIVARHFPWSMRLGRAAADLAAAPLLPPE